MIAKAKKGATKQGETVGARFIAPCCSVQNGHFCSVESQYRTITQEIPVERDLANELQLRLNMKLLNTIPRRWVIRLGIAFGLVAASAYPQIFSASFEWTREAMFSWTMHTVFSHLLNL